jgi:hypothetical protein
MIAYVLTSGFRLDYVPPTHDLKTFESFSRALFSCGSKSSANLMRFQILTAASMKMRAFWDIAPCSLVGIDQCFRRTAYIIHRPDDGGSAHL